MNFSLTMSELTFLLSPTLFLGLPYLRQQYEFRPCIKVSLNLKNSQFVIRKCHNRANRYSPNVLHFGILILLSQIIQIHY